MTEDNPGPTEGPSPAPDPSAAGTPGPETTQAVPTEHTVPVPQYSYPTGADATSTPAQVPTAAPAAPAAAGVALADEATPPTAGGRRRTGLLVGALATVLVLGGAGYVATTQLSGGGAQPADVLPGDAYAYVRLDIDPSAGQKIAAVRFLGKLPQVKDTLGSDDPRKKLWELATKDSSNACAAKFSYDSDIAPWLGDRAGAALRPGGTSDTPNVAIAVQVKDEDAAKDTLTKLLACDADGTGAELRMKDGYALITPKGTGDATVAAVDRGSLADSATFADDMGALGEQGVMSAWFDATNGVKEISKLGGSGMDSTLATAGAKGRFAAALRFDADYVELSGVFRGADGTKAVKGDGAQLVNLPDNTVAAMHLAGGDQLVDAAWPQLKKQLDSLGSAQGQRDLVGQLEDQLDVKLPDDLKLLLGRSFTLALPDQDFQSGTFSIGGKVVTSDAKRADELLGRLSALAGGGTDPLTHSVDGDTVYAATTQAYADALKAGGKLGDSDAFKLAVGDVSSSTTAVFVDLDKIEKLYLGEMKGDQKSFVEALRSVGINQSSTGDGEGTFSLRLVGN